VRHGLELGLEKGTVIGYYLFKRNDANRRTDTEEELRRRLWEPIIGGG
jgi:hypothetical protein